MSRGSVSIDVQSGMSIDVGWVGAVDRRVVSVDSGRQVSLDGHVLLSIDALRLPLWMVRSRRPQLLLVGPEKVSIDSPFSPSIDTTTKFSIDQSSRERYCTGLTCSLGLTKSASACF
ncbi:hypothetical protein F2Q70_00004131 [Brassica cretica]|uniref:Uncharacterized protein n=1 Tax=Brassica cretica TaxID=69181 RepID=A0A8S9J0W3_BRACR|nr:hypothetical protein F2Q70_00004131 [Brassica cretica]